MDENLEEIENKVRSHNENQIVFMKLIKKATGKTVETQIFTVRLLTQEDIEREILEATQDGCSVYKRKIK